MDKIYDMKTKKLVEVMLSPSEQLYLCKLNNKLIKQQLEKRGKENTAL